MKQFLHAHKNAILTSMIICLCTLVILIFNPVPEPTQSNTYIVTGRLEAVSSPCCEDVAIRIEGDHHYYYINRGVEKGVDVTELHQQISGHTVELLVVRRWWSPLDPLHKMAPVVQMTSGDVVLYSWSH